MSDAYIHGTSDAEQARLALMNEILNARCLAAVRPEPGERVLDLGAGTALFASALRAAVGDGGSVVAIERDPAQLRAARQNAPDVDVRAGDVHAPPLADDEWGAFDLAHARFLLEHLADPLGAVRVMLRAVRPGGRVVLIDDDHSLMRFWPEPGGMERLWFDYAAQYARLGNDPDVGRKLHALAIAAGARPVRTASIHYGACAGEEGFAAVAENLAQVVAGARDAVLAGTDWSAADFDGAVARFREWTRRDDAAVWYTLPCVTAFRAT